MLLTGETGREADEFSFEFRVHIQCGRNQFPPMAMWWRVVDIFFGEKSQYSFIIIVGIIWDFRILNSSRYWQCGGGKHSPIFFD